MFEALAMAKLIANALADRGAIDAGADYRITVTDTAGNVAEVWFETPARADPLWRGRWVCDEGCDRVRLAQRITHRDEPMVTVMTDAPPSLEDAQRIVGGSVELITLADGSQLLVDEDGTLRDLPLNGTATALAGQRIVGPALRLVGPARWLDNTD